MTGSCASGYRWSLVNLFKATPDRKAHKDHAALRVNKAHADSLAYRG